MLEAYAVIEEGAAAPSACFESLEAAIEWGLLRFGSGAFRVRLVNLSAPGVRPAVRAV